MLVMACLNYDNNDCIQLAKALVEQWEAVHYDHCCDIRIHGWPHKGVCKWPTPSVLEGAPIQVFDSLVLPVAES